jgi:hypothetical protein
MHSTLRKRRFRSSDDAGSRFRALENGTEGIGKVATYDACINCVRQSGKFRHSRGLWKTESHRGLRRGPRETLYVDCIRGDLRHGQRALQIPRRIWSMPDTLGADEEEAEQMTKGSAKSVWKGERCVHLITGAMISRLGQICY